MTDSTNLPTHVGIIMDGNRRWAQAHGLATNEGHLEGQKTLRRLMYHGFERGIKYLTVYAFSTENFQRSPDEVGYLMKQVTVALRTYAKELMEHGVKVVFMGSRDGLKPSVVKAIDFIEKATAGNDAGTFSICFNYGGQQELVDAVRGIVAEGVSAKDITAETVAAHLYAPQMPPIDLLIRTSGEQRISNFMLWQVAYAELAFTPTLWPDLSNDELDGILDNYAERQRRFGK